MNRTHRSLAMLIALGFFLLASSELTSLAQRKKATPAQTPIAESKPIAVQDHEVAGVEVALLEIKRAVGNTVTIRWHYRNKTNETKKLAHGALAGMDNQRFAQDAYFVDAAEKKYTVLKDEKGFFNAAKHIQFNFGIGLAPKETVSTWAKFPAPPADVEKVTLYLPGAPPFEDVAIGK